MTQVQTTDKKVVALPAKEKEVGAPSKPGEWTLRQVEEALSRRLPQSYLKSKKIGGQNIVFIEWHTANKILSKYAPGWTWEVRSVQVVAVAVTVIGRLTVPTADGPVFREATGYQDLDGSGYGNAVNSAEASAFKRCGAKFGLGLYLYEK